MKRLFRIFDLSKNEQRVLIVMFILITIAFVEYQCRIHHHLVQPTSATEAKRSPTPVGTEDER